MKSLWGCQLYNWLSHLASEKLCRMHSGFTRWKSSFSSSGLIWWLHCLIHVARVISQKQGLKRGQLKLILPGFHSVYYFLSLWQHASGTGVQDNSWCVLHWGQPILTLHDRASAELLDEPPAGSHRAEGRPGLEVAQPHLCWIKSRSVKPVSWLIALGKAPSHRQPTLFSILNWPVCSWLCHPETAFPLSPVCAYVDFNH